MTPEISAIRGPVITYTGEKTQLRNSLAMDYEPDAIIMLADGRITEVGPAYKMKEKVPVGLDINESPSCRIIRICSE